MKAKINIKNIFYYIQGNIRYKIYYSKYNFLLRHHIKEQIHYRINSMRKICKETGQCEVCGCQTTNLQMANKACDGDCYPPMLSKHCWNCFKKGSVVYKNGIFWILKCGKFTKYNNEKVGE